MHIELTTGKDSFRAQGSSMRRNVSVQSFVRVENDGEGKQIIPMFAAYQRKLKGFAESTMASTIPATSAHGPNIGGCWYVNRHEVLPSTEILLEYRVRDNTPGSFGERIEYMMLIADPDAALYQMRLQLPFHHLSAVPYVFFTGRFHMVDSDELLNPAGVPRWKDFLNLDKEHHVSDLLDPNQEEKFWTFDKLEDAIKRQRRVEQIENEHGKKRLKIRRTRNVRIR